MIEKINGLFISFVVFYFYYFDEYCDFCCCFMYFIGFMLVIVLLILFVVMQYWMLLWCLFVVGYGFVWLGYFVFEYNKLVMFCYFFYSLMGDWVMYKDIWIGKFFLIMMEKWDNK